MLNSTLKSVNVLIAPATPVFEASSPAVAMEVARSVLSARPPFGLLQNVSAESDKMSIIVASVAVFLQKPIEAAGLSYQKKLMVLNNRVSGKVSIRAPAGTSGGSGEETPSSDSLIKEVDATTLADVGHDEYYELLGLGALNVNATDEQIKKSFRKLVLKLHPDKQQATSGGTPSPGTPTTPGGNRDQAGPTDPLFLAIQKAYDVLSNPDKRRAYDSKYEFDDAIPSGQEKLAPPGQGFKGQYRLSGDFFQIYGPVFERNGRFSVRQPVPKLGNASTAMESVEAFYAFWFTFESWREFTGSTEHDPNDAEFREEKRWMQKENKKEAAKWKKTEMARVSDLVSRAYARDPRILAKKAAEEQAKKAAYEAKAAAKAKADAEAKQLASDRSGMESADSESSKNETVYRRVQREKEKRAVKAAGRRLKEACVQAYPQGADKEQADVDWWLGQADAASLWSVHATVFGTDSKEVEGDLRPLAAPLQAWLGQVKESRAAKAAEDEASRAARAQALENNTVSSPSAPVVIGRKEVAEWTPAELSALAKAIARYPGGARNRWKMVADAVNSLGLAWSRTAEECIAKAQKSGEEDKKKINQSAFAVSQEVVKSRVGTEAEVLAAAEAAKLLPPKAVEVAAAAIPLIPVGLSLPQGSASPAKLAKGAATPADSVDADGAGDEESSPWTPEQQVALEAALRKYPASMDKAERWKAVAGEVPGKNKKECIARFKEIREKLLASKAEKS